MKISWDDLLIEFDKSKEQEILEEWFWLIGKDKEIVFITSIGDLFLRNPNGEHFWLDIGIGDFDKVADSKEAFENKLKDEDIKNDWFLVKVIRKIKMSGLSLTKGHLYSYKILPILNGSYQVDNFDLTLIEIHFNLFGQLHKQLKDLPEGTQINIKMRD